MVEKLERFYQTKFVDPLGVESFKKITMCINLNSGVRAYTVIRLTRTINGYTGSIVIKTFGSEDASVTHVSPRMSKEDILLFLAYKHHSLLDYETCKRCRMLLPKTTKTEDFCPDCYYIMEIEKVSTTLSCCICLLNLGKDETYPFRCCGKTIHNTCMGMYLGKKDYADYNNYKPFACPLCRDNQYSMKFNQQFKKFTSSSFTR